MNNPALLAAVAVAVLLAAGWLFAARGERRHRANQARLHAVLGAADGAGERGGGALPLRRQASTGGAARFSLAATLYRRLGEELEATGDKLKLAHLVIAA